MNFIGSPELIIALALGGRLSFNPLTDELTAVDGTKFKLDPPKIAPEIPSKGFVYNHEVYIPPTNEYQNVQVLIDPNSSRLQKLEPFPRWDGKDLENMQILVKISGKCTTDHISPAGPWLMYRGHLDKISDNLLLGAINAFHKDQVGKGKNSLNQDVELLAHIAREYKARGIRWVIIGDNNYGEGSSREHAAMSPRYLGCCAVIAKSFARIHETNLKKQGVLALKFANPEDYEKILEDDRISILDLQTFEQDKSLRGIIHHGNANDEEISLVHSYNSSQIKWFKAGSALNLMRMK
jgi:aconitate hydratase